MTKKFFALILLLLLTVLAPVVASERDLLENESLGDLKLGLSSKALEDKIHCAFKRGEDIEMGADGFHHQTWDCDAEGLSLDMISERKGGNKTIASITITTPSKLKTKRGIQIGSSESEVNQAYQKEKDAQASLPKETFVAGSVYGGLMFQFKDDKVESIFLGAGAE